MQDEALLAREPELEEIESFLADIVDGPAALVLEGTPGIGKTTLWLAAVARARELGHRVLAARPAETEIAFAFAALADLLGDAFAERRDELPPPQERALAAALLLEDPGDTADARTIAAATSSLLSLLAREGPLLVAIDDAQWLDPAARRALTFALRRLEGTVGVAVTVRSDAGAGAPLDLADALPPARLRTITVGPLSLGTVHHLVHERIGISPPRPVLSRLVADSGGNPYHALEIARLLAQEPPERRVDDPLPLPRTARELAADRLEPLSQAARAATLAAAAAGRPTTTLLAELLGDDAGTALAEAEAAGVLVLEGERIRFTHPLLASAAYGSPPAGERRALHERLAELSDEPEERARHLARSGADVDSSRAALIETGATRAWRRGGTDAAAELFEAARIVTPPDETIAIARRLLGAATAFNATGDFAAARTRAEEALALARDGTAAADALVLLAGLDWLEGAAGSATQRVEEALALTTGDPARQAPIYAAFIRFNFAYDLGRALEYAEAAVDRFDEGEHPLPLAHALADRLFAAALRGRPVATDMLDRALRLEERSASELTGGPQPMPLIWFHCTDAFEAARRRFAWEDAWLRQRGEELWRADRQSHLAVAELRSGDWRAAEALTADAVAVAERFDTSGPRAMMFEKRALVDAFRGRAGAARATLEALVARYEEAGQRWWAALTLSTLAVAERFDGDDAAADAALARMRRHALSVGVRDVLFDRSEPYRIEALVAAGDLRAARRELGRLARRGRVLPRAWIAAALPAATALVAAAEEGPAAGLAALSDADAAAAPFEAAWALLVRGRLQRRAKQKLAAAETLCAAAALFDELGTPAWAARAHAELDRVGLRRRAPGELTPSEQRVAELAASGLTNREVAATAFMSVKTVEANLARAYRKLGIRSRAELGARIARAEGTSAQT